jgi:hypothetical protein
LNLAHRRDTPTAIKNLRRKTLPKASKPALCAFSGMRRLRKKVKILAKARSVSTPDPATAATQYWQMRARVGHIVYLTTIATAMAGWTWLIYMEIKWLVG